MDAVTHIVALDSFSKSGDVEVRVVFCPEWELDIVNSLVVLHETEIIVIDVEEQFGKCEELGDELSNIALLGDTVPKRVVDGEEHPIGKVKMARLENDQSLRVRWESDKVVEDDAGTGVVSAEVEWFLC